MCPMTTTDNQMVNRSHVARAPRAACSQHPRWVRSVGEWTTRFSLYLLVFLLCALVALAGCRGQTVKNIQFGGMSIDVPSRWSHTRPSVIADGRAAVLRLRVSEELGLIIVAFDDVSPSVRARVEAGLLDWFLRLVEGARDVGELALEKRGVVPLRISGTPAELSRWVLTPADGEAPVFAAAAGQVAQPRPILVMILGSIEEVSNAPTIVGPVLDTLVPLTETYDAREKESLDELPR